MPRICYRITPHGGQVFPFLVRPLPLRATQAPNLGALSDSLPSYMIVHPFLAPGGCLPPVAPGGLSRMCRAASRASRSVSYGLVMALSLLAGWVPRAAAALRAHTVARCAVGMVDGPLMVQRVWQWAVHDSGGLDG